MGLTSLDLNQVSAQRLVLSRERYSMFETWDQALQCLATPVHS